MNPFPDLTENTRSKADLEIEQHLKQGAISAARSLDLVNTKLKDLRPPGGLNKPSARQQQQLQSMVVAMSPVTTHSMIQQNLKDQKRRNRFSNSVTANYANMGIQDEIAQLHRSYQDAGFTFEPESLNRKSIEDSKQLKNKDLGFKVVHHISQLGNHVMGDLVLPKGIRNDIVANYSHALVAAAPA
jgi:hypothetical protein